MLHHDDWIPMRGFLHILERISGFLIIWRWRNQSCWIWDSYCDSRRYWSRNTLDLWGSIYRKYCCLRYCWRWHYMCDRHIWCDILRLTTWRRRHSWKECRYFFSPNPIDSPSSYEQYEEPYNHSYDQEFLIFSRYLHHPSCRYVFVAKHP